MSFQGALIDKPEPKERKGGQTWQAACKTIEALSGAGQLKTEDAALADLVLTTAIDIDNIAPGDAASGRAQLRKAYLAILSKLYDVIEARRAASGTQAATPADRVAEILEFVS